VIALMFLGRVGPLTLAAASWALSALPAYHAESSALAAP
jgi:Trk-type K+ transport system membrane component